MDLIERMAYYDVPGISIVLVNDYQIEWAEGYGVLETQESDQPVRPIGLREPSVFTTAATAETNQPVSYIWSKDLDLDLIL